MPPEISGIVVAITGLSLALLGTRYGLGLGTTGGLRADYVGITLLASCMIAAVAATVVLMVNVSNAQRINDAGWVRPNFRSLSGGLAGSGLATLVCGFDGSLGLISSISSIGLSQATGVASRSLGYAIGALFVVLAFVPWAVYVLMATTAPVMGAMLIFTSMFVLINGLQMITARMLDRRCVVVVGLSFAMAVMADVYRDVFATLPDVLQPVFGNSLVLGTTCAVVLNLVMRIGIRERETLQLAPDADASGCARGARCTRCTRSYRTIHGRARRALGGAARRGCPRALLRAAGDRSDRPHARRRGAHREFR